MERTSPRASVAGRDARVDDALATILGMFETGDLPAAVARTVIERQETDAPSGRWSLGNRLLMMAARTADARGFNQWKQVGRHVKAGAHAFYILAPRTITKKVTDPETGQERPERIVIGFLGVPVFRYEDTEGAEIPHADYTPAMLPPLFPVAKAWGIDVTWQPIEGCDFWGSFSPSANRIRLCTHDAKVFFHELAHAAHGKIRPLKGGQHPDQEIVAETVAAVLCRLYGLDGYLWYGAEYVKGYAGGSNPGRAAMRVLADVEACLDLILGEQAAVDGGRVA